MNESYEDNWRRFEESALLPGVAHAAGGWDEAWERFHQAARAKPVVDVYRY